VPLVLGQEEEEEGWPVRGWVCLALSALVFAVVSIERRLARRGGTPLVSGRALRVREAAGGRFALDGGPVRYGQRDLSFRHQSRGSKEVRHR
jgi:hypothetical protein